VVEFRQCTNTTFEGKCNSCVSPFYQVVQKHKLFDVKCLLIAYIFGNICAKNIKIRSHVSKL